MKKKIVMYRGDEYRAKTEKRFEEDLFFADVYKRANSICHEIIRETGEYLDGNKKTGYKTKFQGMGNNMIAFCAERGQGKTTAMQSYAEYLQEKEQREEKLFGEESIDKEKYHFVVLDPIDPSSLDHGESIVRVLISRLFYMLSEKLGKSASSGNEKEFRKEREDILALFQKCYENIDYLQKEKALEDDDLEVLAQLGNSAQLKKNLCSLVEKFLHIYCQETECGRSGYPKRGYLVVQIDDADLSMGDVFEVCENIRNYFTIPNMIVMMAANYTQLKAAIHERYLNRYHQLIALQENGGFADECHRMAYRYLEKMLPAGHRIDLPEVDAVLGESSRSVYLEYYTDEKTEIFRKETEECENMQDQLLKLLYLRTGIVLLKRQGELHPFLPHTMRELTHFVKLLGDMETVDQQEAFAAMKHIGSVSEVEKWKENLLLLKEYFLNYWCGTHLEYGQQNLMRGLDQAKRNMTNAYRTMNEYLINSRKDSGKSKGKSNDKTPHLKNGTYRNVLSVTESEMKEAPVLQEAVQVYYTILLNEWFVRGIEEPGQFKLLSAFMGNALELDGNNTGTRTYRYGGKYDVIEFSFQLETMQDLLKEQNVPEGQITEWLKTFCVAVGEEDLELAEIAEGKLVWNEDVEQLQFNMFRPVMTLLDRETWHDGEIAGEKNWDTMGEVEPENRGGKIDTNNEMAYLVSAKNLIVNYEVQKYAQERVQRLVQRFERRKTIPQWKAIYEEIYNVLDSWSKNEAGYLGEKSVIREICSEYLGKEMGQLVFLCNDHNREQYIKDYREYLLERVGDIISETEKIEQIASEADMEVAVKRFVTSRQQKTFSGIIGEQKILKGVDQTLDNIMDAEQNINSELKKLSDEIEKSENDWNAIFNLLLPIPEEGEQTQENSNDKDDIKQKVADFKNRILIYKSEIEHA